MHSLERRYAPDRFDARSVEGDAVLGSRPPGKLKAVGSSKSAPGRAVTCCSSIGDSGTITARGVRLQCPNDAGESIALKTDVDKLKELGMNSAITRKGCRPQRRGDATCGFLYGWP